MATAQHFRTTPVEGSRGRLIVPVPFDPDAVWGFKAAHRVGGAVDGHRIRGIVEKGDGGSSLAIGPMWRRDCPVVAGVEIEVTLTPEGPQRADLAPDVAAALDADPAAGAFFDALAQFYRRAYLRWIDGASRRPEVRAQRIATVVGLLAAGVKQRPR